MDDEKKPQTAGADASLNAHVLQLATAALVYMGAARLPGAEKTEPNLPLARLTIDVLAMLKTKTEGNRTTDETALLEDVLAQLRLVCVKAESGELSALKPDGDQPS
jgi:hypothetical protein